MQLSKSETEIFSFAPLDSVKNIREKLDKEPKRDTVSFLLLSHLYFKSVIFFTGKL